MSGLVVDYRHLLAAFFFVATQLPGPAPSELPATAGQQLAQSLEAAARHSRHLWRDSPPFNPDGTINAYIEIPRGERRKFEFDMQKHERFIDRVMPESVGGYPVNYGFVPQTVSYDGDPFDALVLGPALEGGTIVHGAIVGLMHMADEKGIDSKVVLSLVSSNGALRHPLRLEDRSRIGGFFQRYKLHEAGKFSKVPAWDSVERGQQFVRMTHQFFLDCRNSHGAVCRVTQ